MSKWEKVLLGTLMAVIAFLLFFMLGRADLVGDEGHYAFRALHYFDYLLSDSQTTPLQWFGERPWWSYLSFHDHPPLYFFIQHIFFSIFGASLVVARLTSAFAAIGSGVVVFFISRQKHSFVSALISLVALAANSYFIWTGRVGLLESLMTFFALCGIYFLYKEQTQRNFLWAALFFGLAFLSKISFLFIAAGIALYYIYNSYQHHDWSAILSKKTLFAALLFFAVISPYLIYNAEVYATRGHFDVQFTDLLLHSADANKDWPILGHLVSPNHIGDNILAVGKTVVDGFSIPYSVALLLAAGYLLYRLYKKEFVDLLPVFIFVAIVICFAFIGATPAWLGILAPFAALVLGEAAAYLPHNKIFWGVGVVLVAYSFIYTINTNLLATAWGSSHWTYSAIRAEDRGYAELDKKVSSLLSGTKPSEVTAHVVQSGWYSKLNPQAIDFSSANSPSTPTFNGMIVYDINTDWFNTVWIFDRWKFYNKFLILNSEDFARVALNPASLARIQENVDTIYYIEASQHLQTRSVITSPWSAQIENVFIKKHVTPEVLTSASGVPAFSIYKGAIATIFDKPLTPIYSPK